MVITHSHKEDEQNLTWTALMSFIGLVVGTFFAMRVKTAAYIVPGSPTDAVSKHSFHIACQLK